jgi:putative endonuclease
MHPSRHFVYIMKNDCIPPRYYTGLTSDVGARLASHNAGHCAHSSKHRPWHLDVVIKFADETRAVRFEHYLKSRSGCAFARRHLR